MQWVNVGFCLQRSSMCILTGVFPKPQESHSICLHTILELCIQSSACVKVFLMIVSLHRRMIMHLEFHSTGFMSPFYVHIGSSILSSFQRPFEDQPSRHSHYEGLLRSSHLGSPHPSRGLHACLAILRSLDVNEFPMTWCRFGHPLPSKMV